MKKMTICLNMIVKNEANIIVETLNNIRSFIEIDYIVICDTGSSDGTQEIIKSYLDRYHLQGEVLEHIWKDFAHNRNLALDACKGKSDYILVFDADDRFYGDFILPNPLSYDIYHLTFKSAEREFFYKRKLLFRNNGLVKWVGVLHESIVNIESNLSEFEVQGHYYIQTGHFGARSQDPQKYLKDAEVLTQAFENEKDDLLLKARYAYYAATSYYSYNDINQAIFWFKKRVECIPLTPNKFESYLACRYLGAIYKEQHCLDQAILFWLKGCNIEPLYLECFYELSLLYSEQGEYQISYDFIYLAKQKKIHKQATASELPILDYGIDYQLLTMGVKVEEYDWAYQAWKDLLKQPFYSKVLSEIILSYHEVFQAQFIKEKMSVKTSLQEKLELHKSYV
ncbi:hypothetical protein P256_02015 [Acinetobacter nectaris CIP 110549]|uniref:Glycosyltransferase 2-like domain-containing protein n=1 Tax=Acinetobacter nectaris CIP 110549 TaxID=1392540 RepID=V2TJX3_9GAMM|nr:glycosyltransferase [Acinetobacter nectaris]ESK38091.1 hypothetical protein P256_02015 [Acinetobacter nectaris CIP 110549]